MPTRSCSQQSKVASLLAPSRCPPRRPPAFQPRLPASQPSFIPPLAHCTAALPAFLHNPPSLAGVAALSIHPLSRPQRPTDRPPATMSFAAAGVALLRPGVVPQLRVVACRRRGLQMPGQQLAALPMTAVQPVAAQPRATLHSSARACGVGGPPPFQPELADPALGAARAPQLIPTQPLA